MIKPLLLIDLADLFKGFVLKFYGTLYITRRSLSNAPNSDNRIPIKQLMIL